MAHLYFPATQQNRQAIWQVLGELCVSGRILEVASGSGEHLQFFRVQAPHIEWLGSDPVAEHRASIQAWNPLGPAPLDLDVSLADWSMACPLDGIVAINLLHIAPWSATLGLLSGAARHLKSGGWLYLYGAYLRREVTTAPSNLAFDQGLRAQNPDWGVRQLEEVVAQAEKLGLVLERVVEMPANNLSVILRKP